MTGLLFFALVGLWVWGCFAMTRWCMRRVHSRWTRLFSAPFAFIALFLLPVADELAARPQFKKLCERNAVLKIDEQKAKGKTVRVEINPANEVLPNMPLRTLHSRYIFRIVDTEEEIARYDTYVVTGGWLIRTIGISENNAPLTIGRPFCSPPDVGLLDRTYAFNLIN